MLAYLSFAKAAINFFFAMAPVDVPVYQFIKVPIINAQVVYFKRRRMSQAVLVDLLVPFFYLLCSVNETKIHSYLCSIICCVSAFIYDFLWLYVPKWAHDNFPHFANSMHILCTTYFLHFSAQVSNPPPRDSKFHSSVHQINSNPLLGGDITIMNFRTHSTAIVSVLQQPQMAPSDKR